MASVVRWTLQRDREIEMSFFEAFVGSAGLEDGVGRPAVRPER